MKMEDVTKGLNESLNSFSHEDCGIEKLPSGMWKIKTGGSTIITNDAGKMLFEEAIRNSITEQLNKENDN